MLCPHRMSRFEIKEIRELHVINGQLECQIQEQVSITCPMNSAILGEIDTAMQGVCCGFLVAIRSRR